MSTIFARALAAVAVLVGASAAFASAATSATPTANVVAQANPVPTATPKPRWTYRGTIRAYDFTRQNATSSKQDSADTQINQQAFNLGIAPHVDYNFSQNLSVGATYWYLNPYSGCTTANSYLTAPCKVVIPKGSIPTGSELNADNTLPDYQLNALSEAYVQYQDANVYFKGGNQILNTPWAGPNGGTIGSRIMPSSYQAVDGIYKLNRTWQLEVADSWKFLPRTESDFSSTTLLTRPVAAFGSEGFGGIGANIFNPSLQNITTPGFTYGRLGYTTPNLTANFHLYQIYNIASIGWVDAKYTDPNSHLHPFVQFQGGLESSAGTQVAGKINSSLAGLQGGFNVMQNVVLQGAVDYVPTRTTSLVLPTGFSCNETNHTIATKTANKEQGLNYLLPNGGTPDCNTAADGVTTLTYGGWASPYSDGYATDPIFTTSLTQGMTDRRSPGTSYMVKLVATSADKHLVTYLSQAFYDYNQSFFAAGTNEFNFDATYYFNKPVGANQYYKGFILRYRYGDRVQPITTAALPEFKYNRFQAEYDF
jgi:hypothetical protein